MTTKDLTSLIIEDIIAEIPIQMDGDEQGIREEMSALIHSHVERYRQQMVDKAVSLAAEIFSRPAMRNFDKALDDFKAMLNENENNGKD